ncbi:hypothetical protein M9Y10_008909 [Tritrichomonas musculus]|uniref:Ankyrin repeat protein n=1 Tax=Tritrichomonas musculus TaxID=1915356 RepID=A0ABR2IZR1_9EUKA
MFGEFQLRVINAITSGSLLSVRKLVIGSYDIDKFVCYFFSYSQLLPLESITINSTSKNSKIPKIKGPTPLILAILCEQTEIVKYLINEKNANLSIPVILIFIFL